MSKDKINFTHDPDNVLNAFLSMSRNFFLTTSISITMLGVGMKSIRNKKNLLILALLIMVFSIIYGSKATLDFNYYLKSLIENSDFKNEFLKSHAERWYGWIYLNLLFIIPLIIAVFIGIYKLFIIFKK
jgi:hypothetical protein